MIYRGSCHCGAVSAVYETDAAVRLRQDGCGFCSSRGVKSASDPDGRLTLVSLPSSNKRLTGALADYKDHPFSWWEKKGLRLGVGTDNDVTLNTSFIREMLILLYTDALELKITKLLIVTTGESRRSYLSHLLWTMRKGA